MARCLAASVATLCAFLLFSGPTSGLGKAPKLEKYNITRDQISISGISSGGYMAVQFHVAFSETIMGAGITAGGPFYCAQADLIVAESSCTVKPEHISVDELVAITYATALTKTIDPPSHLQGDRVFLVSGIYDSIVVQGVMKKLAEYYSLFNVNISTQFSLPAEHAQITDDYGSACGILSSPYINNCNYSSASHMLQFIYSNKLHPPTTPIEANLMEFDQTEFFADIPHLVSMDTTGYIYIPSACQAREACRLLIALHGCDQGRMYIGDEFAVHAGYNMMAEANNVIVLYPQARNDTVNPKGCWDWWGYTGPDYASKLGVQMVGLKLMLDRVVGL